MQNQQNIHNIKICIIQNLLLHGVLLKKPKEKERIHVVIAHRDKHILCTYTHILLNLVAPW